MVVPYIAKSTFQEGKHKMYPQDLSFMFIFIIMITAVTELAHCQPSPVDCSLHFQFSSLSNNSSCEGGDWGGFLPNKCCDSAFQKYLYALGQRANQTGNIYLNSSEQRSCLTSMKRLEEDAFACRIEKLTSGAGACSNYSVADVSKMLGNKLTKLNENCKLVSSDGEWDQICGVCVQSWEEIRGPHFASSKADSIDIESDVCRFAVMVSLISSRIGDEKYAQNVFTCLAAQDIYISIWILIGGLVVVGVVAIIIIASCICLKRYYKSNPPAKITSFKGVQLKDPGCPRYTIREVYYATEKLNELNLIGEGITGKVYKGKLSNNQHVAIKHITNEGNVETFVREVASLSHVRHPNLVALLGYCLRVDECFLIYELCPNGNLAEWLFGKDKRLSWIRRLEIAIDSARGLWFLHSYSEGCIVHRDIKPANILLGPNFEAKLSDFGLSKVIDIGETYASSEVRGTFGYLDPEYRSNCQVNSSGDVYSFGIVLLQILSGKKVINMNLKKPMHLNKMAKVLTRAGSASELADPKLDREYSIEAFDLTLQLALSCTELTHQRPPMEQVFVTLQKALDISTTAKASTTQTSTTQPSTP
ncbi:hypothetical protein AB3S75_007334 [Citrus x aurantiifolia]